MIREEDPRFRHLEKKVGMFVFVALAALVAVLIVIGEENDLFTKKYEVGFTADNGTGFSRGMAVKLSGFKIGRIKSLSLNEAAKVDVVLQIDRKYEKWIRRDSTARLIKEGLVGDAVVEITPGSPGAPLLAEDGRLSYVKTRSLNELADDIADRVKPVLMEVRDIIGYVSDPEGDIKQSLRNIRVLSRNLETTRQGMDSLILKSGEEVDRSSARFRGVLDDASHTIARIDGSVATVDQRLPALLESTERSLRNIEKISSDLRTTGEKVLPKVPSLLRTSETTLEDAASVMDAVKNTWPIRNRIRPPDEKELLPRDSHD